jgi:hypothetical protein
MLAIGLCGSLLFEGAPRPLVAVWVAMGLRHWSEFLYSLRDGLLQVRYRHRSSRTRLLTRGPEAEIAACTVPIFSASKS